MGHHKENSGVVQKVGSVERLSRDHKSLEHEQLLERRPTPLTWVTSPTPGPPSTPQ